MSIYRFNFSDEMKQHLLNFSKKHSNDDLITFKENFENWCLHNKMFINDEMNVLVRNGFKGDIQEKMYKSIRFYYMKKINKSNEEPTSKDRKKYIRKDNKMLALIKNHIESIITDNMKPSDAYNDFYEKYEEKLKRFIKINILQLVENKIFNK
jgi:hypothetical protein